MDFDDMSNAVTQAEQQLRLADRFAEKLARLLVGRLRHCNSRSVLTELKKELRDWDMHRSQWKERP